MFFLFRVLMVLGKTHGLLTANFYLLRILDPGKNIFFLILVLQVLVNKIISLNTICRSLGKTYFYHALRKIHVLRLLWTFFEPEMFEKNPEMSKKAPLRESTKLKTNYCQYRFYRSESNQGLGPRRLGQISGYLDTSVQKYLPLGKKLKEIRKSLLNQTCSHLPTSDPDPDFLFQLPYFEGSLLQLAFRKSVRFKRAFKKNFLLQSSFKGCLFPSCW